MISTWLTETFDLAVPLVAAPMGGVASGRFAAEVARNGALGMVAAGSKATAESVEKEVGAIPPVVANWGIGVLAWVLAEREEVLAATLAANPRLVSISYGPYAEHIPAISQAGVLVTTQVGTLAEALIAEEAGVDLLVVRGGEGGGHGRDVMATLPLLQEVLERVTLPVVASGGIGNRRGLAAVLAAGAVGAWVGTAFLNCAETALPDEARARVLNARDGDTIYTRSFDSGLSLAWPEEFGGRGLRNDFSDRWHDQGPVDEEAAAEMAGAVAKRNYDIAPVWAGEGVAMLGASRTVADVVAEFAGAEELLSRW